MTITYPLPTLGPTLSAAGITVPQYSDVFTSLQASFQSIYGSDAYISADSQDGQMLAVVAKAITDQNNAIVALYQSFSPSYAQGAELSSLVRINGLTRDVATNSVVVVTLGGNIGTVITSGVVQDQNGNLWNLPATVTIPSSGSIVVTATAQQVGAITAPTNTVNQIFNPQLGWASVNNPTYAAVAGAPVESDAALRIRQAASVALPASTPLQSIAAAIAALPGVTQSQVYENSSGVTDINGVPSHSIDVIVQGGSVTQIAQTIEATKSPGTGTYGSTSEVVTDPSGFPVTIRFDVLTEVSIYVSLTIKALPTYLSTTTTLIQNAVAAFINSLVIGEDVYYSQVQAAASLIGLPQGQTFYITAAYTGIAPSPSGTTNIAIAFNAGAQCSASNVLVTVT